MQDASTGGLYMYYMYMYVCVGVLSLSRQCIAMGWFYLGLGLVVDDCRT